MKKYLFIVIPIIILLIMLIAFIWMYPKNKIDDSSTIPEAINQISETNNEIINVVEDESILSSENTIIEESKETEVPKEKTVDDNKSKQEISPSPPKKTTPSKTVTSPSTSKKEEPKVEVKVEEKVAEPKEQTQQSTTEKQDSTTSNSTEKIPDKPKEETVVRCTHANNHAIGVGNCGKWYISASEGIEEYKKISKSWGEKWENFEIDDETYYSNCPSGYQNYSCAYCGKWTFDYYYR